MDPDALAADALVQEQIAYYRARAPEYDEWWLRVGRYDDGDELARRWEAEKAQVRDALAAFAPRGAVLELAAGTGNYTAELARWASTITAVDASPEALAIARTKLPAGGAEVEFVVADLFSWEPDRRYDVVFFSFWLTHVPPGQWDRFWATVAAALHPGGRVFFVDNAMPLETAADVLRAESGAPVARRPWSETDLEAGVSVRELKDGRRFTIVKRMWRAADLAADLARRGWQAEVHTTPTAFLYGHATRA